MKARKINAFVWVAVAVAMTVFVAVEWHKQGAAWYSLVIGGVFYSMFAVLFYALVDEQIRRTEK